MPAFAVKHNASKRGPLVDRLPTYRRQPCSFTSKKREASEAAKGSTVFVVEVRRVAGRTTYWLGYKFVACKCVPHPAAGRWHDQFRYMNESASTPSAIGVYFDVPVEIDDESFHVWFAAQRFGMVEVPPRHCDTLEAIFTSAGADAKSCA